MEISTMIFEIRKKIVHPWRFLFIVTVVFSFFTGFLSSFYAPGFAGGNKIAGIPFWQDNDPGSAYLKSAHEIFRRPLIYAGHPGIPLQIGNVAVQKVVYWIYGGDNESYTECIVRKLYQVQVLSRLIITLIWLASAFMVKKLTVKLFHDTDSGYIAAILFLTMFPLLYYLNRVSPEPYMIFFFLLSFYFLINAFEQSDAGDRKMAIWFISGSSAAAVAAFYSKIHLFGGFPLFIGGCVLWFFLKKHDLRNLAVIIICFLLSAFITIIVMEPFMDWPSFSKAWFGLARTGQKAVENDQMNILNAGVSVLIRFVSVFLTFKVTDFLPFTDKSRLTFVTEYILFFLYLISFGYSAVRKNRVLLLMNLNILFPTYIYFYRGTLFKDFQGFHYLFPLLTVCCIQVAYLIQQVSAKIEGKRVLTGMLMVFLIHIMAISYGVGAHKDRIVRGEKARKAYLGLSKLKPGEEPDKKLQKILPSLGIFGWERLNKGEPSLIDTQLKRMRKSDTSNE